MSEALDTLFLFGKNYCATLAIGFVCAYLGLYCVLRRIVFTGVALAQLAAAGVAGAFFLADRNLGAISRFAGTYGATWGSLGMSLLGVLGLELRSKKQGSATPDALVGLAYAASSAVAILLVWRSSRGLTELQNILAGEVLLTGEGELYSLWVGLAAVAILHLVLRREFLLVSFDPEFARAQGLQERRYQLLLLGSLAVAVALSLKAGGLLLVFAFLVLPPVAGLTIARGLEQAALFSALTAGAASFLGFLVAIGADWPVGPTVSVCLLGFVVAFRAAKLHPTAQTAARWIVGAICGVALLMAPISLIAGPSAPDDSVAATPPAATPVPTSTTSGDGHGHPSAAELSKTAGIDLVEVAKLLKHGTTDERQQTLETLGRDGGAWALQPLLGACLDDEPGVREAARTGAQAVVGRDPEGLIVLSSFLEHAVPELRLAAALTLHALDETSGKVALIECLGDQELPPFHRLELLEMLTELNGGEDNGFDPFAEEPDANLKALAKWWSWAGLIEPPEPRVPKTAPVLAKAPLGHSHGHFDMSHGTLPGGPGRGSPLPGAPSRGSPLPGVPQVGEMHLEDRLRSNDPKIVQVALDELRAKGASAVPELKRLLEGGGGHDHGDGPLRVDPTIPARLLVELNVPAADAVLSATITGPDPVAALGVIAALDIVRHRALLEETARGPRTQERRAAIERLAVLDEPKLAGVMELGAREGTPAAMSWLGRRKPELLVAVLRDHEPETVQAALQTLDPSVLAHAELRPHLYALLRAGPYEVDGELVRDPRPALAALADASRPEDLDAVLDALTWSQDASTDVLERAEAVWDRLSAAHPKAAQAVAVAMWTSAPGRAVTPDEDHALARANVLASELSWSADPLAAVAEAWPGLKSDELRTQLADALLEACEGWGTERLEPLGAWIALLDEETFPTGLAILQTVVSETEDPAGLSPPLRAALAPLKGTRRERAVRVALGGLSTNEIAAAPLRWLRREDLRSGGPVARHILRSFELGHDPQDLDVVVDLLPASPPPEEEEEDDHAEDHGGHVHPPIPPPPVDEAFAFLARNYPERARSRMLEVLREGEPKRRVAVAHRLHTIPGGLAVAGAAWQGLDPAARSAAAASLLRSADPAVTPWLLERERELSSTARAALVRRAGQAADARGLSLVERALSSPDPELREAAREALTAFQKQAKALEELRVLQRPPAASTEEVEARLLELLEDSDRRVVLGAIRALSAMKSTRALPRLVELLRTDDSELHDAVQRALDRIDPAPQPAPPAPKRREPL